MPYWMVTFTLPHSLNPVARSHQKLIYDRLFETSTDALTTLALNPDWVGGKIGMVGALHTWDRSMGYHLHVHYLVPAGGIDPETSEWRPSSPTFLVPASALREVFRAKFRDALHAADAAVFAQVPPETWAKEWVVHCKAVGNGETALKYLTPYIYRVALSNRRLVSLEDGDVTFRFKPHNAPWTTMTLDAISFLHRFLQHVLPKGFHKIRYSGFLHPNAGHALAALQEQLTESDTASDRLPESLASTFGIDLMEPSPADASPTNAPSADTAPTDASPTQAPSANGLPPDVSPIHTPSADTALTDASPANVPSADAPVTDSPRRCPQCGGTLRHLGSLPQPYWETRAPP